MGKVRTKSTKTGAKTTAKKGRRARPSKTGAKSPPKPTKPQSKTCAPAPAIHISGVDHRNRMARRSREQSISVAEIGPPPKRDEKLWQKYRFDLPLFLQECFPHSTGLSPLSPEHLKIARRTQDAILNGGCELFIVFRGFAKSTLLENSVCWSCGYGHTEFFVPLAATREMAAAALASIQNEFETNDQLMLLFPAACHAARALEGIPQRAKKQSMDGKLSRIEWSAKRCVLPTYEGFEGSGAIIWPKGILSNVRGLRFKRADGTQVRPTFIGADDLQTDQSAASPASCQKRISALTKTIMRLGGHRKKLSMVINATVIEPDDMIDQLSNPETFPMIRTLKVPMLQTFSKAHDKHWLGPYAELLTTYDPEDDGDRARARREANEYYKKHRREMDDGAVPTWESCFEDNELSAIQHAYNILIETGEDAFNAECQNTPLRDEGGLSILKPELIARKQHDYPRGQVPPGCELLACHVDVHLDVLYFETWAFDPSFTAYKIDEGYFPDQHRSYFAHRTVPRKIRKLFAGMDPEAALELALDALLHGTENDALPAAVRADHWPGLCLKRWTRTDGVPMKIESGLVDANGEQRGVIVKVLSRSPFAGSWRPSFGRGITAAQKPISSWQQARAQKNAGPEWIMTRGRAGEVPGVLFDTNYWKARFHRALSQPKGNQGGALLYKANPSTHRLAAEHYVAEKAKEVAVGSRTVYEFELDKPDNHKFDNAVGCWVAASRGGITNLRGRPKRGRKPQRRKTTYF